MNEPRMTTALVWNISGPAGHHISVTLMYAVEIYPEMEHLMHIENPPLRLMSSPCSRVCVSKCKCFNGILFWSGKPDQNIFYFYFGCPKHGKRISRTHFKTFLNKVDQVDGVHIISLGIFNFPLFFFSFRMPGSPVTHSEKYSLGWQESRDHISSSAWWENDLWVKVWTQHNEGSDCFDYSKNCPFPSHSECTDYP